MRGGLDAVGLPGFGGSGGGPGGRLAARVTAGLGAGFCEMSFGVVMANNGGSLFAVCYVQVQMVGRPGDGASDPIVGLPGVFHSRSKVVTMLR